MKPKHAMVLLPVLLFISCTSSTRFVSRSPTSSVSFAHKQNLLTQAVKPWLGVPYRWGGHDHTGIDCSGLVQRLYREAFGIRLPRSAKQQRRLGYAVHPPYLQAGDLLFFRFAKDEGIEHVGIYLGDNRFVHASQTRGVVIESLESPYYRKHLVVVRRLLH